MPSQKLVRILRSKSPFTEVEISQLSEHAGWNWVYANTKSTKKQETGTEICFTGFGIAERDILSSEATSAGFHVVGSVTKGLAYLCLGDNPGASKVQKAQDQNVQLLSRHQLTQLIETGELPPRD